MHLIVFKAKPIIFSVSQLVYFKNTDNEMVAVYLIG
jgi:hypothetical protein